MVETVKPASEKLFVAVNEAVSVNATLNPPEEPLVKWIPPEIWVVFSVEALNNVVMLPVLALDELRLVAIEEVAEAIEVANEAEAALKAPLIDAVTLAPADPKTPFASCTTRLVGPTLLLLERLVTVAVPSTLNAPVIDRAPVNW